MLLVALFSLSTFAAFSASAAPTPPAKVKTFKLESVKDIISWKGIVGSEDAPQGGEPIECQFVECEHFKVAIDLPENTFSDPNKPGSVQFAIRWFADPGSESQQLPPGTPPCCGEFDALNLYVYRNTTLAGASSGIIATGASTLVPSPPNGLYDVWIASDPTYNVHDSVAYEALAEVEFAPNIQPVRELLPDLEFRGSRIITFDTPSFPLFEPDPLPMVSARSVYRGDRCSRSLLSARVLRRPG
jgi:hypothetical protein